MASSKQNTVSVACPKCGHRQPEPRSAYSTICKKCQAHFRLEEALRPAPKSQKPTIDVRHIRCFQCGTELEVPVAAESTMCKRCSSHVDLRDYQITSTVSKNYRTYGRLVLEEKGYMMNTDSLVGEAIIKGRFIGKITAVRSLEIYSSASFKGTFSTGRLIVPAGNHFRWPSPLELGGADIAGELAATVRSAGTVILRSTARLFGDVDAANVVVEPGAVLVGALRVGPKPAPAPEVKVIQAEIVASAPTRPIGTRSLTERSRARSRRTLE